MSQGEDPIEDLRPLAMTAAMAAIAFRNRSRTQAILTTPTSPAHSARNSSVGSSSASLLWRIEEEHESQNDDQGEQKEQPQGQGSPDAVPQSGAHSKAPMKLRSQLAPDRSLSFWGVALSALLAATVASGSWLVGLFGFVYGLPVLALLGAAAVIGTAVLMVRTTGRGWLTLVVVIAVPALVLLYLSRQ